MLIDTDTGAVQRIIALQYNPETIGRTLQLQGVGADNSEVTMRVSALRGVVIAT